MQIIIQFEWKMSLIIYKITMQICMFVWWLWRPIDTEHFFASCWGKMCCNSFTKQTCLNFLNELQHFFPLQQVKKARFEMYICPLLGKKYHNWFIRSRQVLFYKSVHGAYFSLTKGKIHWVWIGLMTHLHLCRFFLQQESREKFKTSWKSNFSNARSHTEMKRIWQEKWQKTSSEFTLARNLWQILLGARKVHASMNRVLKDKMR